MTQIILKYRQSPFDFHDPKKPPPTQLKTTTERPIYPNTCPFHY